MSRSGYGEGGYCDDNYHYLYRATVGRATKGPRGQKLLRDIMAALDAMPVKELASNAAVDETGRCCTLGAVEQARGGDLATLAEDMEHAADYSEFGELVRRFGAPETLLREIMWVNDEEASDDPAERWAYMRRWAEKHILPATGAAHE